MLQSLKLSELADGVVAAERAIEGVNRQVYSTQEVGLEKQGSSGPSAWVCSRVANLQSYLRLLQRVQAPEMAQEEKFRYSPSNLSKPVVVLGYDPHTHPFTKKRVACTTAFITTCLTRLELSLCRNVIGSQCAYL